MDHDGKTVVGVYVDHLLVTETSKFRVDDVFKQLVTLQIKDLGVISTFLVMRHTHFPEFGYRIDQGPMIDESLTKFGLQEAHHVMTPVEIDHEPTYGKLSRFYPWMG